MPLPPEALGALVIARRAYIESEDFSIPDFIKAIELHTEEKSEERTAWFSHVDVLTDAMENGTDLPPVPGVIDTPKPKKRATKKAPVPTATSLSDALSGTNAAQKRTQIRAQRILDDQGAAPVGETGPSRGKNVKKSKGAGAPRDTLVDDLVIEEIELQPQGVGKEPKKKIWIYCVACDNVTPFRNPKRSRKHALECEVSVFTLVAGSVLIYLFFEMLKQTFPNLYKRVCEDNASRATGSLPRVRTKSKVAAVSPVAAPGLSEDTPMEVDSGSEATSDDEDVNEDAAPSNKGTIKEYFEPVKMTEVRQAAIDLALFQAVICCALPFSFVENPWLVNLLLVMVPNYVTPERSAFFTRQIADQVALFVVQLKAFLLHRYFLTLSLDGWSSRGKDEIYTFHTTLPSRRSIFTLGHVFKGVSVTAEALFTVVKVQIFGVYGVHAYSAVVGDGGSNVRALKRDIAHEFAWILNIYDPCHLLNLFLKDIGKLFKVELSIVSGISNYFSHSNAATYALSVERKARGIKGGMKSASDTRFGTSFIQSVALRLCFPAIVACIQAGTIAFTTKATKRFIPYFDPDHLEYPGFQSRLSALIQLLEAGANGITTLEGQNVTCADVFYVWVTIAWHLERLVGSTTKGFSKYRSQIITIYNARFEQMMTESSHNLFLLAYYLHPLYFTHGGLKLFLPDLREGEKYSSDKWTDLFRTLRLSARAILHGEQLRCNMESKSEASRLTQQLVRWLCGHAPFHKRAYITRDDKPLDYWKAVKKDSNADVLATVAIILFSISPSEICDERTASLLGWMNAARRSSMTAENLVHSAQLSQWYKHGLSEGNYQHTSTANIRVSNVDLSTETTVTLSAPTLMDLLNDQNVDPTVEDQEALEKMLFEQEDPFDLDECDRVDSTVNSEPAHVAPTQTPFITRMSTRWAVTDFVRLDSPALGKLIIPSASPEVASVRPKSPEVSEHTAVNQPWDPNAEDDD
ncbi:unnamed protein product [Mycena citricolor]|uniref:DUF659 domain-containing protein n=1 Tax=Mycena citricolor TaxID=2018698 RepID=A0AAD2HG89_9AGAR|nr:unnamed protein product [Mycena citricolor]CAK5274230.1 unnamed protein product [Mycena citricolor]